MLPVPPAQISRQHSPAAHLSKLSHGNIARRQLPHDAPASGAAVESSGFVRQASLLHDTQMEPDLETARKRLDEKKRELEAMSEMSEEARAPVTLDQQSVGRLSRMDAMQQQQMAQAQERARKRDLVRIEMAERRLADGEYGFAPSAASPLPGSGWRSTLWRKNAFAAHPERTFTGPPQLAGKPPFNVLIARNDGLPPSMPLPAPLARPAALCLPSGSLIAALSLALASAPAASADASQGSEGRVDRPDQLVLISFDGAHDNRLWERSLGLGERTGAKFTYFLSCTFLISKDDRRSYKAPGHSTGRSNVGFAPDGPMHWCGSNISGPHTSPATRSAAMAVAISMARTGARHNGSTSSPSLTRV
jgi:DnaK suppressor protein